MFIYNYNATMLINTAHIVSIGISAPQFERNDYTLVANMLYGTQILRRGTRESCEEYMRALSKHLS